jgi:hypothetical protein
MLLLLAPLAASSAPAADVHLTHKGGVQRSWAVVSGPFAFDTDAGTRFAGGLGLSVGLGDRLSFDPELLYTEVRFTSSDFEPVARITSRSWQVVLPLTHRWNTNAIVSPHVAAGPQIAFVGRTRQDFGGLVEDIGDDLRDTDVQVLVGAGIGVKAGKGRATFDLRHAIGLRNLDETENDIKVRGLQFLIGYRF